MKDLRDLKSASNTALEVPLYAKVFTVPCTVKPFFYDAGLRVYGVLFTVQGGGSTEGSSEQRSTG